MFEQWKFTFQLTQTRQMFLFLYFLKTSENVFFSDVFNVYEKGNININIVKFMISVI